MSMKLASIPSGYLSQRTISNFQLYRTLNKETIETGRIKKA